MAAKRIIQDVTTGLYFHSVASDWSARSMVKPGGVKWSKTAERATKFSVVTKNEREAAAGALKRLQVAFPSHVFSADVYEKIPDAWYKVC